MGQMTVSTEFSFPFSFFYQAYNTTGVLIKVLGFDFLETSVYFINVRGGAAFEKQAELRIAKEEETILFRSFSVAYRTRTRNCL